jgi:GTP cyclohydrolase I
MSPPDRSGMERAVRLFLEASGVPLDDPDLAQTPARVAAAWADEFIDGYAGSVPTALGELLPASTGDLVLVTHLDFTGLCPHHLLPYRGVAHLAYRTGGFVAGFGRLGALVDTLAHRLTLQEILARQLAEGLVSGLSARGAGVILQAEQTCLTLRGEKQPRSRTVVEATAGEFDAPALDRLWRAVGGKSGET